MQRFIGWGLVLVGGAVTIWASVCALTGTATTSRVTLTPDLSFTAMTAGLAGAAVFTVGLIWVRD